MKALGNSSATTSIQETSFIEVGSRYDDSHLLPIVHNEDERKDESESLASSGTPFASQSPSVAWWWFRWVLAGSLLIAAVVLFSVGFGDSSWIALSLHNAPIYLPFPSRFQGISVLITTLMATGVFGWPTLREELQAIFEGRVRRDPQWPLWVLVFSTTVVVLARLINRDAAAVSDERRLLEIAILVPLTLASWCLVAMPARFWLKFFSHNLKALLLGPVVGLSAYVLGRHYTVRFSAIFVSFERSTLWMSSLLLHLFTRNIVFEPSASVIGTANFKVVLLAGCSGVDSITLFLIFFSAYLWFYRSELRFPWVLMLLPVGAATLYLLNVVRIVALILIGSWSHSLAVDGFHSVAGWLLFNTATLGLLIASRRSSLFAKTSIPTAAISTPSAPYLVPLLLMIAVAMVSKVFLFRFDLLYPLHVVIGAGALWLYRKRIAVRWEVSWSAIGLGIFVFAVWIMLAHGTKDAARDAAFGSGLRSLPIAAGFSWILFRVAGAVAVVPIAEELAYRGYLMRRLVSADFESVALTHFTWLSFLVSSILFGVLHSQWIPGTLAGMIFAFAVYRYGSLSDGIVSHMTANALLAAYVLMTGHWFLWN